ADVPPLAAVDRAADEPAPSPETERPAAARDAIASSAPHEPPRTVEAAIGLTWATRIGGLLLLAGVAFFFKYAVDNAWLGPWARVGLGAAVGLGALLLAA